MIPRARHLATVVTLLAAGVSGACSGEDASTPTAEPGAALLGGETTVFDESFTAYSLPAKNLTRAERDVFSLGDHFFNRNWVSAPASTSANDGLGPLFNATSCSACHRRDGRSAPPVDPSEGSSGLLFRLSVAGADEHGGPRAEPTYGGQLQPLSNIGVPREARYVITYVPRPGSFEDGEPFELVEPSYAFADLAYGPLEPSVMTSPRTAPAMIGLGLLEALSDEAILAAADPDDRDHDGVSGRVNMVWDVVAARRVVGRFGWKANVPSVAQQVAGAFAGDLGITTSLFPDESCSAAQRECTDAPTGGRPELSDDTLREITHYSRTLAVPARRHIDDPIALRGEGIFRTAGCASCHLPKLVTAAASPLPGLRDQVIRPYTDLLLHDMGPALADGRPDFEASGTEWRTAPLWGLGLLQVVSKHTRLLHDGRARGIVEAILWHGGEGERAREAFRTMAKDDRAALLAFLASL